MKITVIVVLVVLAALLAQGFIASNTPEGKERAKARDAIELCWKEQQRKSLDPAQARFIAGACEKMEDDFRRKHNRNP